jgi:hypothetical protein
LLAFVLLASGHLAPFHPDNVLDAAGIGPFTLYDALPRGLFQPDRAPGIVWPVATGVAAFGAMGLVVLALVTVRAVSRARAAPESPSFGPRVATRWQLVLALAVLGQLAPFALTDYFDRYLLPVVPLLCALWALAWPRAHAHGSAGATPEAGSAPRTAPVRVRQIGMALGAVWLVLSGAFAAFATHDYFAWNRARAAAIAAAERRGATPETLDGGYEYNGYHRLYAGMVPRVPGKSWWWVQDDRWIVTFGPVPGYAELATFPVDRWLARTPAAVHLLERRSP